MILPFTGKSQSVVSIMLAISAKQKIITRLVCINEIL